MRKKRTIYWHFPHLLFMMGGAQFLLKTTIELNKQYDVIIVTNKISKSVKKEFDKQKIKVLTTSNKSTNDLIYWLFFPIYLLIDIYKSLKYLSKANIVFCTSFQSNVVVFINKIINKKEYYFVCYEPFPFFHNKQFINGFSFIKRVLLTILSFLYSSWDIMASQQAMKVFTLNEITKKMNKQVYGVDSVITLMGVDSVHFSQKKDEFNSNKYKKRKILVHSTDYTLMKNTDLAIKATSLLVKKYPKLILLITSTRPNAPEKSNYIKLVSKLNIENNVEFLDLVDYEKLPILYSNAFCYLSCSYDEMLGTTSSNLPVKEALACGTPAIRANITTEDVEDGISGFLVDPRDTGLVAKKLEYLIKNPEKAKKMGLTGRKKIVKLYKWENVAKTIINAIEGKI